MTDDLFAKVHEFGGGRGMRRFTKALDVLGLSYRVTRGVTRHWNAAKDYHADVPRWWVTVERDPIVDQDYDAKGSPVDHEAP